MVISEEESEDTPSEVGSPTLHPAVTHSDDSERAGAITVNLLGAALGEPCPVPPWTRKSTARAIAPKRPIGWTTPSPGLPRRRSGVC
jgi:hypothetical protein